MYLYHTYKLIYFSKPQNISQSENDTCCDTKTLQLSKKQIWNGSGKQKNITNDK